MPGPPRLTVVLVARDGEHRLLHALKALGRQGDTAFEVLVLDAGSTDGTLDVVRSLRKRLPFPVRWQRVQAGMPLGAARNLAAALARAPLVAFLGAGDEPGPAWVAQARAALARDDVALGRRGGGAAYRRNVLARFPADPWAQAAIDAVTARRAAAAGLTVRHAPGMATRPRARSWRRALRHAAQAGLAEGRARADLGLRWSPLAWAGAFALGAGVAAATRNPRWATAALALAFWGPGLRHALRRRQGMPWAQALAAAAASPVVDTAWLAQYLRGLASARRHARAVRRQRRQVGHLVVLRRARDPPGARALFLKGHVRPPPTSRHAEGQGPHRRRRAGRPRQHRAARGRPGLPPAARVRPRRDPGHGGA